MDSKPSITQSDSAAVDYLKVIGVILVLIEHSIIFSVPLSSVFQWPVCLIGITGVALFAYTAGFLAKATSNDNFNPVKYVIKRFFRLYPLYLIALVLTFGVTPGLTSSYKISSLFLLQSLSTGGTAWFSLWFVPFIMLCYVFFSIYMVNKLSFKIAISIFTVAFILEFMQFATSPSLIVCALELPVMLLVFFVGVRTVHMPLKIEKAPAITRKLSRLTYPIYLFQYPFFVAISQSGLVLPVVYLTIAFGLFYLSTYEDLFKNKRLIGFIPKKAVNNIRAIQPITEVSIQPITEVSIQPTAEVN